jgi:hypothetical protein
VIYLAFLIVFLVVSSFIALILDNGNTLKSHIDTLLGVWLLFVIVAGLFLVVVSFVWAFDYILNWASQ